MVGVNHFFQSGLATAFCSLHEYVFRICIMDSLMMSLVAKPFAFRAGVMWELDFVKPHKCRSLYIECPMELYGQHLTKT